MFPQNIRAYQPQNEQEAADQRLMLTYLQRDPDTILTRENEIGHITSSGFIVNADASKVLFAHHNLYRVWAWTGGHADGEPDLLKVAMREAAEETGVTGLVPLREEPASMEVLTVRQHQKRGKEVPAHLHLNVSFVLLAPREGQRLAAKPDENSGVRWLPAKELARWCTEEEMLPVYARLVERAETSIGRR